MVGARPPLKPPGVDGGPKNLGQEAPPNHRLKATQNTRRVLEKDPGVPVVAFKSMYMFFWGLVSVWFFGRERGVSLWSFCC